MIELASFEEFNETHHSFLNQLMETVGIVLNTIAATMRTEGLLKQSQLLTQELQARQTELTTKQEELHNTNEELQEKAQLLENEKRQVEAKNFEIEMARRAVEEKAEQLALTSKYKSEFLANMSHELRTPLNSLLILSKLLADNQQGNLNEKQTEFARTIHWRRHRPAQPDQRHPRPVEDRIRARCRSSSATCRWPASSSIWSAPSASSRPKRASTFEVDFDDDLPADDPHRREAPPAGRAQPAVQRVQVHRARAASRCRSRCADGGWSTNHPVLRDADQAIEIAVSDTGIGIPQDKQKLIFEAFQQADGTTSRKYGGTGLGLSISREIARLLGGELQVRSTPGEGSTFTLYVPLQSLGGAARAAGAAGRRAADGADRRRRQRRIADDRDDLGDEPFVLIVEDDPTFAVDPARPGARGRAQGRDLVGRVGHGGDGPQAAARARSRSTSACRDIDGFVLLDLLRHDPETARHPGPRDFRRRAGRACADASGAAGVIEKPADRDELVDAVRLDRRSRRGQPQEGASAAKRADGRAPARDAIPELAGSRDPDRRRRHPQHLLADQRAREPRRRGAPRRARRRRHRDPRADARHRRRAGRHHDARDGRLRDDAADPRERPASPTCR